MMQLTDRAFHSMDAAIAANPTGNGSDIFCEQGKMPLISGLRATLGNGPPPEIEVATYQVRYSGDDCLYRWVRVS